MDTKEQINIKEQAEIYAYKHLPMGCFDFDLHKQMLKIITQTYLDAYKKGNGYSNRLAEGKPEWHDLREQPSDLPKEEGSYWCCIGGGNLFFNYDVVYFSNNKWEFEARVIAWIELPHFAGGLNVRSC